ncbi:MAG: nicotinate-nucleotide adenylyltransferase [Dehalococcoidales bacterium]|nr:nicotinate-nucleotide adenylyltransferase [Dehalococcoidales bacterium]
MKIGVLGGTFDPIHQGHLVIAEEVVTRLNLAEILFVPAGQPWLKMDYPISAAEHRVQMVRLAIAGKPGFKLSTMEIERAGPTYTVDTIAQLQVQFGAETELFFILGWDNLNELPQWREPSRLVKLCHLVAVPRPGYPLPDLNSLEAVIPGLTSSTIILDTPEIDISASEIRNRVAQGLSISHLVPKPVDNYIREHRLYT